jgi:flagellar basal-body rod protein FlgC
MIAFNVASSGLYAGTMRMNAIASNVANAGNTGAIGDSGNYRPVDTVQSAQAGGGVASGYATRDPAEVQQYDPNSVSADGDGMIAAPNVDLVSEGVAQLETLLTYKANVSVVRASDAMDRTTIDLTA